MNIYKYSQKILQFFIVASIVGASFAIAHSTYAATLYFGDAQSYTIGQTISLPVYVSTTQAINAVSATVNYPSDKLQLSSLSKTGSIITLWTQEPSMGVGNAQFEGIAYNPGYTGSAGKIITLVFKVKAAGSARISFSSASVLANDGQATNILDGTRDVTLSLGDVPAETTTDQTTSSGNVTAPNVYSPTHPDPQKWYASGDVTMKWDTPADITSVKIAYDKFSSSAPTIVYTPPISEKSFTVTDGIWYFHAQEQNASGWSPITHFKLQVDTSPPSQVKVEFPQGASSNDPQPQVFIQATDSVSGIDHYDLRIGDSEIIKVTPDELISNIYRLPLQDPGAKKLEVTAYDKAGNSSSNDVAFEVIGIDAPTLDPIADITEGDILQVIGKTFPNIDVTVFVKSDTNKTETAITKSNSDGSFKVTWQDHLPSGAYSVTAQATNQTGAKSYFSHEVTFAVKQQAFLKIGLLIINYTSLLFIILALFAALSIWAWYLWHKLMNIRNRVIKKIDHADSILRKKFTSLKDSVVDEISRLESAKKKRKLTAEEEAVVRSLKKSLDDAETLLEEEIEDIKNF